jgi:phosphoglycerol transferase MdoB-like AlkP superfamily enzyme
MRQRLLYLIKTYLLTVIIFIVAKIAFMLLNHAGHEFTAYDMMNVIRHGMTLDLSTSLYILIVPFLIVTTSNWWDSKWLQTILRFFYGIVATLLMLAFVADTSLYPFWGFKLDATCLQYLETPAEARASVSGWYMTIRILAIIIGAIIIYRLYTAIPLWNKKLSYRKTATVGDLLLIPVFIIGIRGGLDESTTNIGQVYFSQNQFLNHSAVNPVFSFLSSFEKTASNIVDYDYFSQQECDQLMKGLYPTETTTLDTLLTTQRPNIVIVLMESAGEVFANAMPRLQQLKKEGIDFSNCYANSWRTDRGTVSTYSGYPSFPTSSVMKMPMKTNALPGIAAVLQKEGYNTSYLYGGDINFTNMRSYLIGTGWEKLTWKADYTAEEQNSAKWGVRDEITFQTLYNDIMSADSIQHYLFGFSTLSSHEPWDVPLKKLNEEIPNAFYYLDHCLGDFIDKLKKSPQWDNLLVIFLPDHSFEYGQMTEAVQERNRIPMVWVGGAVKGPRKITQLCNQTDLAATLLAQLGLPHNQFIWSRDVLSSSYQYPFAVHNYNNGFSVADSTGFMVYDLDSHCIITNESHDAERLERMGKAVLQATTANLKALGNHH